VYAFGRIIGYEEKLDGSAATKYWTITDHLGSVMAEADILGTILDATGYADFGAPGLAPAARVNGHEMLQRYTGKDYDPATGLTFFNARWYSSELGRFITEDPIRDGVNWFIFCNNNPLRYVDMTGLRPVDGADRRTGLSWVNTQNGINIIQGGTEYRNYHEVAIAEAVLGENPRALVQLPAEGGAFGAAILASYDTVTNPDSVAPVAAQAAPAAVALFTMVVSARPLPSASTQSASDVVPDGNTDADNFPSSTTLPTPSPSSRPATVPLGRSGNPIEVARGTNSPAIIDGVEYTGHAQDQMQGRGVMPSAVSDTIGRGAQTPGREGATVFTTEQFRVVVNPNGSIKTVIPQ